MKFLSVLIVFFTFNLFGQIATESDISYGKHQRNKLDLWKAKSTKPTPVLVFFHGGGFKFGDKRQIHGFIPVKDYLGKGVSCISVNYPFLAHTNNNYLAIMKHCEDSLKFIKKNATKWGIDPKRISLAGCSAGALISQYLGYKTKDVHSLAAFMQPMGTEYFVLPNIKKSSPPVFIYQQNPLSDKVHHPKYAKMVKETCNKKGAECILYGTGKNSIEKIPNGKNHKAAILDFFLKKWALN